MLHYHRCFHRTISSPCEVRSAPARPAALRTAHQTIRASRPAQVPLLFRTTLERMEHACFLIVSCILQVSAGDARLQTEGMSRARKLMQKRYVVMRAACAFRRPTEPFPRTPHAPAAHRWRAYTEHHPSCTSQVVIFAVVGAPKTARYHLAQNFTLFRVVASALDGSTGICNAGIATACAHRF
jgi:hypothetical protein